MSKPVLQVTITSPEGKTGTVRAVIDSGSFFTILREDKLPAGATILPRVTPQPLRAATRGSAVTVVGQVPLVMAVGGKIIDDLALVSSDLAQEMIVGAKTMQAWDISIVNRNGQTDVVVGRDMRDPDLTAVD